jgi:hypothetical protein
MSKIELTLVNPVGVSKFFFLLDVAVPSPRLPTRNLVLTHIGWVARVPAFDNLGDDSSQDVHKTPSPKRTAEKRTCPLPSTFGEFLLFKLRLFSHALITIL